MFCECSDYRCSKFDFRNVNFVYEAESDQILAVMQNKSELESPCSTSRLLNNDKML